MKAQKNNTRKQNSKFQVPNELHRDLKSAFFEEPDPLKKTRT